MEKKFNETIVLYNNKIYRLIYKNVKNILITIAETMMWLYEKHGIWIEVRKYIRDMLLCFSPYIDNTPINSDMFFNDYDSPIEAYQEDIKHTLDNLIK